MGNGFPGPAIVSLIALLVALGAGALISLHPWTADTVDPHLSVAPGVGVALDDSVAVSRPGGPDVADAQVVLVKPVPEAARPVADRAGDQGPELAIAQARPVARLEPATAPKSPPSHQATPQPTPVSIPAPVAEAPPAPAPAPPAHTTPVSAGAPPIAAGVDAPAGSAAVSVQVHEGDEYALSLSFYAEPTAYRPPGEENLIVRFRGEGDEAPGFGLHLWDDGSGSGHGLWSSGDAMDGERFLAPVEDLVSHELTVDFRASSTGDGFYLVFLDGQPIDLRSGVDLIESGSSDTQLEVGLFRDGEVVESPTDVSFEAVTLGDPLESVP